MHTLYSNHLNSSNRLEALQSFIAQHAKVYQLDSNYVSPASSDASFRRYFRVLSSNSNGLSASYIVMDAPPEHENCTAFIKIAHLLANSHLNIPTVLEQDLSQGFLLLKDLGDTTYLHRLQQGFDHKPLYQEAIKALVQLQKIGLTEDNEDKIGMNHFQNNTKKLSVPVVLPMYTADKLQEEMGLFETWFLNTHHNIILNAQEQHALHLVIQKITHACMSQATVCVHRDYHCRNLMYTTVNNPGILDFQDAVMGPYTYDLVSLLRDAYIDRSEEDQIDWAIMYWKQAKMAGIAVPEDFGVLWRDFEWMGLQRHLKILGIFARLSHRDGKHNYLNDLPLVLKYIQSVVKRYDGLKILVRILNKVQAINHNGVIS